MTKCKIALAIKIYLKSVHQYYSIRTFGHNFGSFSVPNKNELNKITSSCNSLTKRTLFVVIEPF